MKKISALLIAGIVLFLFSCQKEDSQLTDGMSASAFKSAEIAASDDKLELALSEVQYESDFYSGIENLLWMQQRMGMMWAWNNLFRYATGKCPGVKVTATNDSYPKTITLDYGTGTSLNHGRVLKGVIVIEISAPPRTDGATHKVTYKNFAVDTITINGTATVLYSGDNKTKSVNTYNEEVVFKYTNGKEVKWKGQKTREWKAGLSTPMDMTDDVITINGTVNAEITGGDKYKKEIVNLVRKGGCWFIVQGTVKLTINGNLYSTLDYGTGECDAKATLKKGTETIEIDLVKNMFHKK